MNTKLRNRLALLLATLATFSLGGASVGLADEVNPPNPAAAPVLRIGTVLASPAPTADKVSVRVFDGGDPLRLTYQTGYVPVAGDVVNVLMLGGSTTAGIVLGGRAGQSGNLVVNGNFYRSATLDFPAVNNPPYHWFRYVASGTAGLVCQVAHQSYQRLGMLVAEQTGASSDTSAYSSPFPVAAGLSYKLTTFGRASTFVGTPGTVQSKIAWFADATTDYPNFLSEQQFPGLGIDTVPANSFQDIYHYGTVTAPAGATNARIVLRSSFSAGSGINTTWFEAIALKA